MTKRMLIDASHPEETRVAVVSGNRLDDFDYESAERKQLKGNIYLAKVTRVEPSLQAAFVEYGGNRHGFLPFSEIHPDYYRIPVADREALLAEEASHKPEAAGDGPTADDSSPDETALDAGDDENGAEADSESDATDEVGDEAGDETGEEDGAGANGKVEQVAVETSVDTIEGDDEDNAAQRRARFMRRYKIQEVIKRRQVLLVQVTKEERGNKGAALTTYLSLAGRYCVLMPNTARGGGISRKINSAADRRRLKSVVAELDIPEGVAVIVRTAGSERSKPEIRRDYDYLLRLWSEIRDTTLNSSAPSLIYEEANLIKRAIRDLYRSDMEDIVVDGEMGHKAAKAFMKSLMPSHARNVKLYKDEVVPLYQRHQLEGQIDAMYSPTVQLKSGGYIVINVTEALVAIDVNSGKATRARHIEETAYKTNLETADEVARQLRLRDLAGLIVIDFIDMEESRHNRSVERRLKEALRNDRARIQIGRISPFGLLEMSRQRLRPSLVETSTGLCPVCKGIGHVRTTESSSLHVMRALEEDAIKYGTGEIVVAVSASIAIHLLNKMRARLVELEQRHGLTIRVDTDESMIVPEFRLERLNRTGAARGETPVDRQEGERKETSESDGERRRGRGRRRRGDSRTPAAKESVAPAEEAGEDQTDAVAASTATPESTAEGTEDVVKRRRRRGKRGGRRRGRRDRDETAVAADADSARDESATPDSEVAGTTAETDVETSTGTAGETAEAVAADAPATDDTAKKKTRSRRSGSSRRRSSAKSKDAAAVELDKTADAAEPAKEVAADDTGAAKKPAARKPRRRTRKTTVDSLDEATDRPAATLAVDEPAPAPAAMPPAPAVMPAARKPAKSVKKTADVKVESPAAAGGDTETAEQNPRRGWWQRWG